MHERSETRAVTLFEDASGRLVIVDAGSPALADVVERGMLRIGRALLPLRHLAPAVVARLLSEGHARVDGGDALNVLLAFAEAVRGPRPLD